MFNIVKYNDDCNTAPEMPELSFEAETECTKKLLKTFSFSVRA